MTIEKIEWFNFQPHRVSVIKPSKSLTVIVGTSRNGKSSLVRGIRWAVENKPRGEDFKNWDVGDKDSVAVGIVFEEGTNISRERTPSYNQYHVSNLDKPLRAIRADVPNEVSDITQMSSVNIQSQLDPYFMLPPYFSPGEVGRMLNEAVELEIIDVHRDEVATLIRKTRTDIAHSKERLREYEEEVKAYANLDEIGKIIDEMEVLIPQINEAQKWVQSVGETLDWIATLSEELKSISTTLSLKKEIHQAINLSQHIENQQREADQIRATLGMITITEKELKDLDSLLEMKPIIEEIVQIAENVSNLRSFRYRVDNILRDIHQTEDAVQSGFEALSALYSDRDRLFEQLSICPFCKQPITDDVLRHIKEME